MSIAAALSMTIPLVLATLYVKPAKNRWVASKHPWAYALFASLTARKRVTVGASAVVTVTQVVDPAANAIH